MQDNRKAEEISRLLLQIATQNSSYSIQNAKYYFDYDTVLQKLQEALDHIENTLCCERPDNLPEEIPWCDRVASDCSEEINPYVYAGMMTAEEYKQMHEQREQDDEKCRRAVDGDAR